MQGIGYLRRLAGALLLMPMLAACGRPQPPPPPPAPSPAEQVRQGAAPSVVNLVGFTLDRTQDELRPAGSGSAVAVSADAFLTDCRNLVGADVVALATDQGVGLAFLDSEYYGEDICVLRSQEIVGVPVRAIRDAATVRPGEQVFAVADPQGQGPTLRPAVVTAKQRDEAAAWLQTTIAVTSGWSGGAIFDAQGNLLGVAMRPRGVAGRQVAAFTRDAPRLPTRPGPVGGGDAQESEPLLAIALPPLTGTANDTSPGSLSAMQPAQRASLDRFFTQRDHDHGD